MLLGMSLSIPKRGLCRFRVVDGLRCAGFLLVVALLVELVESGVDFRALPLQLLDFSGNYIRR